MTRSAGPAMTAGIENGVRNYSAVEWHNGILLLAGAAMAGWIATLCVRETGCRNIYEEKVK